MVFSRLSVKSVVALRKDRLLNELDCAVPSKESPCLARVFYRISFSRVSIGEGRKGEKCPLFAVNDCFAKQLQRWPRHQKWPNYSVALCVVLILALIQ